MGNAISRLGADYAVTVVTGDRVGAGTNADVSIILKDVYGDVSPEFKLDSKLRNDFEKGSDDTFYLSLPRSCKPLSKLFKIIFWRDEKGLGDKWYVKYICVKDIRAAKYHMFPVLKWVKAHHHYVITEFDTSLPQFDTERCERSYNLRNKRADYVIQSPDLSLPAKAKELPSDEAFSFSYTWDILSQQVKLTFQSKIVNASTNKWESLSDIMNIYSEPSFPIPKGTDRWRDDLAFARQRTHGCSISLIKLCTAIPDKLEVSDEVLAPFLEELTIAQVINDRRLFIVDLEVLSGLEKDTDAHICAPIALFFENTDKRLTPIAIQLEQEPGPTNPVFVPSDPEYTWLMAKIWFNNADAMYHQSCSHLGFTHLIMEGAALSMNRQLSQSHPLYKLLAPHFLYVIAINSAALTALVSEGGWVDQTLAVGATGMLNLVGKAYENWRVDVEGTLPAEMAERGLLEGTLNDFPYRDDALLIYDIIKKYVSKIVNHYYDDPDKMKGDWELQAWGKELVMPRNEGGVGLKGVPGNGSFSSNEEVIVLVTSFIFVSSVVHAAVNFPQYDEYGYPPAYPGMLKGKPPFTKAPLCENDLLAALPDVSETLDMMTITKLLSRRGTKPLGDFEVNYVFDPPAQDIVAEFREDLKKATETINERNKLRYVPYTVLLPGEIPNSISI